MKTNFEHLRSYGTVFGYVTHAEEILVRASTKEELEDGYTNIRKALEGLVKELGHAYRCLWDEETLYERIVQLEKRGIVSAETANDLHFIRKKCNKGSHFNTFLESRNMLTNVYRAFYRQSYLIVHGYLEPKRVEEICQASAERYRRWQSERQARLAAQSSPEVQRVHAQEQRALQAQRAQAKRALQQKRQKAIAWKVGLAFIGYVMVVAFLLSAFV